MNRKTKPHDDDNGSRTSGLRRGKKKKRAEGKRIMVQRVVIPPHSCGILFLLLKISSFHLRHVHDDDEKRKLLIFVKINASPWLSSWRSSKPLWVYRRLWSARTDREETSFEFRREKQLRKPNRFAVQCMVVVLVSRSLDYSFDGFESCQEYQNQMICVAIAAVTYSFCKFSITRQLCRAPIKLKTSLPQDFIKYFINMKCILMSESLAFYQKLH